MIYFFNGHHVKLLSEDFDTVGKTVLSLVEVVNDYPYQLLVNKKHLQPIVDRTYNIGDVVKAVNSDYIGIVTSFELDTNSVITKPYSIVAPQMRHVRYTHNVSMVEPFSTYNHTFRSGKTYLINDGIKVMAVTDDGNKFSLVTARGEITHRQLEKSMSVYELYSHSINTIKQITFEEWAK